MDVQNIRYQVALFGSYEDITPSLDNIQYFLDAFKDKGLLPSYYSEIRHGENQFGQNANRFQLISTDRGVQIIFGVERIDIYQTNVNVGTMEMPDKSTFIKETIEMIARINSKFNKTHKRIGFVTQTAITSIDLRSFTDKALNTLPFLKQKPPVECVHKIVVRDTINIPATERLNISVESLWQKAMMRKNNQDVMVDGLLTIVDINTHQDNHGYRFSQENIVSFLEQVLTTEEKIVSEHIQTLSE
ncbi:hypothetical protein MKQ68_02470 [Chitinophaga horti]|uniref:TIGR04255 family protein n=1 Tax=Chitinophaga horti TaxID=2920382 RepID=A0ABY6J302_9BACT|nr:hypothetical protein [Chitinophaga horti]UYQ93958.1 hypothetical protein MKQ68_02470 [Chitinophaga horti]